MVLKLVTASSEKITNYSIVNPRTSKIVSNHSTLANAKKQLSKVVEKTGKQHNIMKLYAVGVKR